MPPDVRADRLPSQQQIISTFQQDHNGNLLQLFRAYTHTLTDTHAHIYTMLLHNCREREKEGKRMEFLNILTKFFAN